MNERNTDSQWVDLDGGSLSVPPPPEGMIWKIQFVAVRRGRVLTVRTPFPAKPQPTEKIDLQGSDNVG